MKKTIVHLIPSLEGGGTEKQLLMLIEGLSIRNWDIHLCCSRQSKHDIKLIEKGVKIYYFGKLSKFRFLIVFFRILFLSLRIKPLVINTWLAHMDVLGGTVAVISNSKWIMAERSSVEAYLPQAGRGFAVNPILVFLREALGKFANQIVANSYGGVKYWQKILGSDGKISCIPNAIDFDAIENSSTRESNFFDDQDQVPLFLSVGSVIASKNHKTLIEGVRLALQTDTFNTLILGEGLLAKNINNLINKYDLDKRVKILPFIENWWGIQDSIYGLIHASLYEGMPNVVLEAMAAKFPLILSDIKPHKSLCNDESALIFKRLDPESLASAIKALIKDRASAKDRSNKAHELISDLTIDKITNSYEILYSTLIK